LPAITYSGREPIRGPAFTCKRCGRTYALPTEAATPIRCECGWWYAYRAGVLVEEFRPRLAG
jgi:hypothetical protein